MVLLVSSCPVDTSLKISISGIITPDSGSIEYRNQTLFDGKTNLPPEKRVFGMVFQDLALFPHMTVTENIAYGLRSDQDQSRVKEMIDVFAFCDVVNPMFSTTNASAAATITNAIMTIADSTPMTPR